MPEDNEQSIRFSRATQLIMSVCDESITEQQIQELQRLVCDHSDVRRFYVRVMHMHAGLYYFASALPGMVQPLILEGGPSQDSEPTMDESLIMPAIQVYPEAWPESNLESNAEYFPPSTAANPDAAVPSRVAPLVRTGIAAGILLLIGMFIHFAGRTPSINTVHVDVPHIDTAPGTASVISPPPVFVLYREFEVKPSWEVAPAYDKGFSAGDNLALKGGCIQLKFLNGGRLVVEGPAHLKFQSDTELILKDGRIAVRYPGGGLVIQCPHGSVTDLGTEFGVNVNVGDDRSEVEVFAGKVSASVSSPATTGPATPLIVRAGEAAMMNRQSVALNPQGSVPQRFISDLANQNVNVLDMVDLISGGNGTTKRRGIAIDAVTGELRTSNPNGLRSGDGKYHRVANLPVIDGAFVPDGSHGSDVVDSAGDRFMFPASTNQSMNCIWTGGVIPWPDQLGISTKLNGTDYSAGGHSIVCTHADNAFTLDLDAVRRLYPGRRLARFRCAAGNSYVNGMQGALKQNPTADLFVLLDGKARFRKLHFTNNDGLFSLEVSLLTTDRFLTLGVVDDGKDNDRDWVLWTDPKLELSRAD